MKSSEKVKCERFVCELKGFCRMAYLGSFFCSHYCDSARCFLCQKQEECKLEFEIRQQKQEVSHVSLRNV